VSRYVHSPASCVTGTLIVVALLVRATEPMTAMQVAEECELEEKRVRRILAGLADLGLAHGSPKRPKRFAWAP
jgi:predicted transcriptional regulator